MIDEAWEYWVPDPEIAEVLAAAATPQRPLDVLFAQTEEKEHNHGLRLGRGHPDRIKNFKLKHHQTKQRRELSSRRCVCCKQEFQRKNWDDRYCSLDCKNKGWQRYRVTPDQRQCRKCDQFFKPARKQQIYCNYECARHRCTNPITLPEADYVKFVTAWFSAVPMTQLVQQYGAHRKTIGNWARALGLPPRTKKRA